MAAEGAEQLAHGAVVRNRVAGRLDRHERVAAVGVGAEAAAQVHVGLGGVLLFVEAVSVGLPHVQYGAGNRRALGGQDPARHDDGLAAAVAADGGAGGQLWCAGAIEGGQQGGLGSAIVGAVIDGVHQDADPERVGQQDELLAAVVAHLADACEELDGLQPLRLSGLHLADEGVQVADQTRDDRFQSRVRRGNEGAR